MVTTLYLIRHGETEGGDVKRYKGSIDVPLSERGVEQARRNAAFLFDHPRSARLSQRLSYLRDIHTAPVDAGSGGDREDKGPFVAAVYCSPLSRALTSAEIIASPHGLKPTVRQELRERSFGVWEGLSFIEIKERYPAEFEAWATDPLRYSPINGESTLEVRDRVIPALDAAIAAHPGESIVVVAHGGVNRIILCHLLGIPLENIFRIEQSLGSINVVEFWEKYPVAKLINYVVEPGRGDSRNG